MPEVLIVGAGPVGLTLASELARYGVGVRIVDRAAARTDKSKAIVLWSRTLELLDRGGPDGAAPFVEVGHKLHAFSMMHSERVVGQVSLDAIDSPYNYALAIPQSETERLLEERLARQGVIVERGKLAGAFEFGRDGVSMTLTGADGLPEVARAEWLIGCDGAHSAVRHALDAPFVGKTFPSDWMLADVHIQEYPRPYTEGTIYWHRDGVLLIVPLSPGRYRVIADMPAGGEAAAPSPTLDDVQALVDRRGPPGTKLFDPVWLSGFRINSRKVARYRHGRAFLAGDAAHIHSPAGGQGMNTGMQDAFNLAWKLAMVARGVANDGLLDSYTPERSQVGEEVLRASGRLTSIATIKNPVAQTVRDLVGRLLLGSSMVTGAMAGDMAEVTLHYSTTPLNGVHAGVGIKPGCRVPPLTGEAPIGAGDVPRFVLRGASQADAATLAQRFGDLIDADIRPLPSDGVLSLVRPDGYLACSARDVEAIAEYLCRWSAGTEATIPPAA